MGLLRNPVRRIARFVQRAVTGSGNVEVAERDGVRSLHLGNTTVQSAMRLAAPYELELAYTRGMMAFMMFHPQPRKVLLIGLGGGSIPKFIRHYLAGVHVTAVEIDPRVIAAARNQFFLPRDDEFLRIVAADGADYVHGLDAACDVLLLDAYDSEGISPRLCSRDYYDACAAALTPDGILVANLWGSDRNFDIYLQRIEQAFNELTLVMPTGRPGNILVFGFRRAPGDVRWAVLRERAQALQERYCIDFLEFAERLRDNNPGNKITLRWE